MALDILVHIDTRFPETIIAINGLVLLILSLMSCQDTPKARSGKSTKKYIMQYW